MSDQTSQGVGGLTFDHKKRAWPNEFNVFLALILITLLFEVLGQVLPYMNGQSMLFDFNEARDGTILNMARIKIIILQVAIIGIISLGVTQVIISGGIDLSSGPLVGATAMIAMSFAQTELVNGNPNPKAVFGLWAMDLPVIVPVIVGLYIRRVRTPEAIASIAAGVAVVAVDQITAGSEGVAWLTPAMLGLAAALTATLAVMAATRKSMEVS